MPSSSQWLIDRIAEHGDKVALHSATGSATFAGLHAAIGRMRARLQEERVNPGDVVVLAGDYGVEALAFLLALAANRNVIAPVSGIPRAEIEQRAAIVGARHVIEIRAAQIEFAVRADAAPTASPLLAGLAAKGHAGLILFSSGSTGEPKAMVHDFERLLESYRDRRSRSLTLLVFLLFDHIGGLHTLLTSLASGTTLVIPKSRDPEEVCAAIERHRVAVLPTSPTFLNLLLLSDAWRPHDLSSLRIVSYGTEAMPEALLRRLRATLPRVKFIQTFGTSETGITHTTSKSSDSTLVKLDDPNVEHRIVDGELWLRSRTQILGYLNHDSRAFTDDGWFKTGDLVEAADDGFLRITGRRSEVINVGGEKVLPGEVETVLLELPEIVDCTIHGESSAITGQFVAARVVLAPGVDPAGIRKRVRIHCRERLAAYKIPARVEVVAEAGVSARFKKMRPRSPS